MNAKKRNTPKDSKESSYEIHGTITESDGKGISDAQVIVWWQLLRKRLPLAKGRTTKAGEYRLRFHPPKDSFGQLLVVVEARSRHLSVPLTSPLTSAQASLQINLSTEPVDQSEFTMLMRTIRPLLDRLPLLDVVENTRHQDISFLAQETGKSTEQIMRVVVAARLEATFDVPAAGFYSFLRQNVPSSLPSPLLDASDQFNLIDPLVQNIGSLIFALPADVQQSTLTAAVALDIIGPDYTTRISQIVSKLQALRTTDLLNQPYLVGNATLAQLLDVVALPPAKQQAFAQALATNSQSMQSFWQTLGDGQHGFTEAEASSIQRTLSVGAFVKNFVPLVQILVQQFTNGTYKTLADLAQLNVQDWLQLVKQTGTPPNIDPLETTSPAEVFANIVYARISLAYPTVALASRITVGNFVPPSIQRPLVLFFQNNRGLELISDNIPAYLASQGPQAFAGINARDQAAVIANARIFQRVLRVAPNVDAAQTLLNLGLNSATQIAAMGEQQFFAKITTAGLSKIDASAVFQAAASRYANVVSTYMNFNQDALGIWPKAMGQLSDLAQPVKQAIQRDQSLATLFGSQDYCAIDDCTSVLSPAAYLCDLLLWLRNRSQGSGTALDVLDSRRPDIRHLLLNCPNSDTELPYIDLVIELLADKVNPAARTSLKLPITSTTQTSITVATAVGFPNPSFTVVIGVEILLVTAMGGVNNSTWTVVRGQQGTSAAVASAAASVIITTPSNPPWKQTSEGLTAAQLSAAPEYFNQGAFNTLFSASYPQTLPYSTGLDELRTYLQQWNLPLWQLRQALLPVTGGSIAQQAAVAAERLGMNVQAENLVTTPDFVPATVAWNVSDFSATPPNGLATVPVFLQAASLTYEQLLELLEVDWVQGGLGIMLVGLNDTCDTSGMALSPAAPLDPGFLDRAHRFLRLWLATGYKMWELDLLLTAPSVGNGVLNQKALVALQAFWQLQNATGLAVDKLLALFQNIDIDTHRDPDGTTTTSLYSRIFLNPTTTWIAPDPDLVSLSTGGVIGDPILSDHVKAIQPALGVSASDLAMLIALTDNQLTLDNLSQIYRVNALAVASKFSVSTLLNFVGLLNNLAAVPATTLTTAITTSQNTITVASNAPFRPPNFYIKIGAKILLVTAVGGVGNTTWTVLRGQLGTIAAGAAGGTAVTSDSASPMPALASLFSSPAATLDFLMQAKVVRQQTGLTLDAINYLLAPPSSITDGWATTSQMTPANIAATLGAVQQTVLNLLSTSATLATAINATQTTITVTNGAGFPAPNFYVYIGSEILLVTALGGAGNNTWTVARAQQGTQAALSTPIGTAVTPTAGDLNAAVIAAVAANAHSSTNSPLSIDVATLILQNLSVSGVGKSLLSVLMDPLLLAATGTITIGGSPAAGDTLQAVLTDGIGDTFTVLYTLTLADSGSVNQTASDFAQAINASPAVIGLHAFLAPCAVSGAVITLTPLAPGAVGSSIASANTAAPGGVGHVSVSPASTETIGQPSFQNQFLAIQLFDKVGVLVRGLRLVAKDLSWLLANAAVYGGLDFNQLPVAVNQAAINLPPLLTTLLTIKLARLWNAAPAAAQVQTLYDIIGGVSSGMLATEAQAQAALATITGWPLADIESFAAALGLVFPGSYEAPATYDALRTLEAMSAAVGASGPVAPAAGTTLAAPITLNTQISITVASAIGFPAPNFYINIGAEVLLVTAFAGADNTTWTVARGQLGTTAAAAVAVGATVTLTYGAQIVNWGSVPADEVSAESMAASALGILKAQQSSEDSWLALAPTLMNPIRERQSSALQAYLIAQRDGSGNLIYGDTDGLFDYFLIDTQMTSCEVTSRIVQAYIAVQIFVERCLMNLEAPEVVVDLNADNAWTQWQWMKRYRIWEANREVFLYPENWLIESQRPNRSEIFQKFEQEVRQGESTTDYLETVVLNYIDRLDGLAHLLVTGTCQDPDSDPNNPTIYVVARTLADPPVFYLRSFINNAWTGWTQIPLDIKAHQAVPAIYRGRICLFWLDVKVSNEPNQPVSAPQASSTPPSQNADRYVMLGVNFSIFRNGSWAPAQAAKGKLFDKPIFDSTTQATDSKSIEAIYTLKVKTQTPVAGVGATLYLDVFRLGSFDLKNLFNEPQDPFNYQITGIDDSQAVHLGRAVFNGRFNDLELQNFPVPIMYGNIPTSPWYTVKLLQHAQGAYGPDAQPLLPLNAPDPNLKGEPGLEPQAGALAAFPSAGAGSVQNMALTFTSASALEQNSGKLLNTAQLPFRIVGPVTDLSFDPTSYFFFQDNRRCYYVQSQNYYQAGSMWSPVAPSNPSSVPYQVRYFFHIFYHPFTLLFWNQLAGGGFDLLYDPSQQNPNKNLQENPDQIDSSGADQFSFNTNYSPVTPTVNWDHDDVTGQDRQFLDFRYDAAFAVYNWELFYHIPLFAAQLLSQNQQFEDAQKWFHYIFNPTRQGSDPAPQRFWIPKPLHNLTSSQIIAERINELLAAVNAGNQTDINQVNAWRQNSFNPFVLADLRDGVPYMKSTVMSYLDNLIAWGDNLFSTESREALSEATLLYVLASEILGPTPTAVTPPQHADESFDQLEPTLDAFANALVEIENVIGGTGGSSSGVSGAAGSGIPLAQTFYFKIPPNATLLNYWNTVADRLFKLRNCQNIAGAPLQLALFDAPIDPGLLIAAQAAGVDFSSVLSDVSAALPNYRFTTLYSQALDFVNAVRAYGASLQAALVNIDASALALLQQTTAQQLLADGSDILDWQVEVAQSNIDALTQTLALAQQKHDFNNSQPLANAAEIVGTTLVAAASVTKAIAGALKMVAAGAAVVPNFTVGAAGFGGSPVATANDGGVHAATAAHYSADSIVTGIADLLAAGGALSNTIGSWEHRKDNWVEAAAEANIQIAQANIQIAGANLALQIAQQNQMLHQEQIDNIQKQIDFLNDKFSNNDLYNWMAGSLAATYFQSYQLAYQLCKQVERCYQFELGIQNTSFIQFGYWNSLYKGLLSGETLNHDLRRMQASYLQQNARRYELSRYVSLGMLNPPALQQLLVTGKCDFDLPELLFDNDYPGHYNRRLTRLSVTVVYPNPGKFDNVKATLTLIANRVRIKTDTSAGYAEQPVGSDPRFIYSYAANSQKIAMGNAQDDPGLFITAIASNIADQRYLPFENAGAISSWHLEMPQNNNEVDLSSVGDVVLHLYYTALDGGSALQQAAQANNIANLPTSGIKVFSAQNDFSAPAATVANPYPVTPWQAFLATVAAPANQTLTLAISPSKFPAWTRGKTISVTSVTVLAVAWPPGNFVLAPQAPLPTAQVNMVPVAGVTEPNVCAATIAMPPNTPLGTWSFELQQQGAADFRSLTKNALGDVLLLVSYDVS